MPQPSDTHRRSPLVAELVMVQPPDRIHADHQGRSHLLSLRPNRGSKSTNQTPPRLGVGAVDIQVALPERLECGQAGIVAVLFGSLLGGEYRVALVRRQAAQLSSGPAASEVNRRS